LLLAINFETRLFTAIRRMSKVEESQGLYTLKFNWKSLEPLLENWEICLKYLTKKQLWPIIVKRCCLGKLC